MTYFTQTYWFRLADWDKVKAYLQDAGEGDDLFDAAETAGPLEKAPHIVEVYFEEIANPKAEDFSDWIMQNSIPHICEHIDGFEESKEVYLAINKRVYINMLDGMPVMNVHEDGTPVALEKKRFEKFNKYMVEFYKI